MLTIQCPPALKKGDTIALVATARKISPEELKGCINTIEAMGFRALTAPGIHHSQNQMAGTDQQRAEQVQWAYSQAEVKAVWVVRGGYGTARIMDYLDLSPKQWASKWLLGYSDITVLHGHLTQLNIASMHATMPINFSTNSQDCLLQTQKALLGERPHMVWEGKASVSGEFTGKLVGGNLSVLYSLMGCPEFPQGEILFIEDLDEYLYHIDRMLLNLRRSGVLGRFKALLVGGLSDMNDNAVPFGKTAAAIVEEHAQALGLPVVFDFPAGHIDNNMPLIMGSEVKLKLGKIQRLSYL